MILFEQDSQGKLITIQTAATTYQMCVTERGFLLHLYYGPKAEGDLRYLLTFRDRGFSGNPYDAGDDRTFSMDALPQEYPCYGNGDYRFTAFEMCDDHGIYGCDLRYAGHEVIRGKYSIPGLPAVYGDEFQAATLKVILRDEAAGVEVTLLYGMLADQDVITRAAVIRNIGERKIEIHKAYSGLIDFMSGEYDVIHFHGRHGMERQPERVPVMTGTQSYGSRRGTSSHQQNPFLILAEKNCTETQGTCYAMQLLYSGNFHAEAELDQYGQTRMGIGLQDEMFAYPLEKGEVLYTPEVVLCCAADGMTHLSHILHTLIRKNICRNQNRISRRPVPINNWEATYFDFNGEKLLEIAKQAAALGVEMFVLDDGWFGARDDDNRGLGDWTVNEKKLGGSLKHIVDQINAMGMQFGIWIEPEMVNEDSDLYRAHPDWAFTIPGRKPVRGRNQLVLDFSRPEVVDAVYDQIDGVLRSANIAYVKMDMNRSLMDICTKTDKMQNQGVILYRYVLGVYAFLEKLRTQHPELLIEGCSGGGGRFDAGMLYYVPQIWCSDNTDAIDRITIQYGTSFGYPVSAVGSHVSAVPNEQTGRSTPMHTRGVVAMAGNFGYELDLSRISEEDRQEVKRQIADCRKYWKLTHEGLYYRLTDPLHNREFAAWEFASEDRAEALLNVVTLDNHCNNPTQYVRMSGLDPEGCYEAQESGCIYRGSALMQAGVPLPFLQDEYQAWQVHFIRKQM